MQQQIYNLDFKGKDIYMGIDAHLKSWRISIMVEGILCKTFSQDPIARILKNYLDVHYPEGNYYSAYEAGFCGFAPHRDLLKYGIKNIVVNPADIPTTDKEKKQKEDGRDSRKIVRSLHNKELEAIYIPSSSTSRVFNAVLNYRYSPVPGKTGRKISCLFRYKIESKWI